MRYSLRDLFIATSLIAALLTVYSCGYERGVRRVVDEVQLDMAKLENDVNHKNEDFQIDLAKLTAAMAMSLHELEAKQANQQAKE